MAAFRKNLFKYHKNNHNNNEFIVKGEKIFPFRTTESSIDSYY